MPWVLFELCLHLHPTGGLVEAARTPATVALLPPETRAALAAAGCLAAELISDAADGADPLEGVCAGVNYAARLSSSKTTSRPRLRLR